MATQDEVNRQHMEAMGLDPDSLGKPAPKAEDPERCESRALVEGDLQVRCALNKGHEGSHMRGKRRWASPVPEESRRCPAEITVDNGMRVQCREERGHTGDHYGSGHLWANVFKQREGDQPLPVINDHPDIQAAVIADIETRREVGISRYGTALQPNNGRDALQDLYEELIDAAMYAKQLIVERDLRDSAES